MKILEQKLPGGNKTEKTSAEALHAKKNFLTKNMSPLSPQNTKEQKNKIFSHSSNGATRGH